MSTAVMSQSAMYEFGDIIKNSVQNAEVAPGAHLAVGSPAVRYKLTRMASTPVNTTTTAATAVNLVSLLNISQHRRLERTQSAPAPNAAVTATTVNTSRYKTELCRPYEEFGVYVTLCTIKTKTNRLRPAALSPSLSLDSPSPPCSLSQSPTSSMGSFFSSEPELHSPGIEDQRLPVFNRLAVATPLHPLRDLLL
ncbi:hypothetical protein Trydic_g20858 [Trypoxylus dichotomus]